MTANNGLPDGHTWHDREIKLKGKTVHHRHCNRCERDFATLAGEEQWTAVYVGIFELAPLTDEVNSRWLTEHCPGSLLPGDRNELRIRKIGGDRNR
jgi:hypothetical protein